MTQEEKIEYMRLAAGMCNFGIDHKNLDLLVSLYELIIEKKGDATMRDAHHVEDEVKKRADLKARTDLLDQVSKKV
jgi:hypothetical protein